MKYLLLVVMIIVISGGCQWQQLDLSTKENIRKEVLEKEPSFSDTLTIKAKADEDIGKLQAELNETSQRINSRISELKQELSSAKKTAETKIKEIDLQLNPCREEIKTKVKELISELKTKESSLSSINRMISKLNKIIEQGSSFGELAKETPKWQDKIVTLRAQGDELEKEISSLRDKIRLNRNKIKLLK